MATTFTANARLQKPATSDRNWDAPINSNTDVLDALTAIGGLMVTPTETPSATLQVSVAPGNFSNSSGLIVEFTGTPVYAIPPSSTNYLWLTDAGILTSGPSFPSTAHLRLAHVVSNSSSLVQIVDERVQCSVAGTGLGNVLRAGDTMTGPLTIAATGAAAPLMLVDPIHRMIGFFGATPASQAPALTPLASQSPGIASDTLGDVGQVFSQTALNNNFASLVAKVDAIIAALKFHGLMGS